MSQGVQELFRYYRLTSKSQLGKTDSVHPVFERRPVAQQILKVEAGGKFTREENWKKIWAPFFVPKNQEMSPEYSRLRYTSLFLFTWPTLTKTKSVFERSLVVLMFLSGPNQFHKKGILVHCVLKLHRYAPKLSVLFWNMKTWKVPECTDRTIVCFCRFCRHNRNLGESDPHILQWNQHSSKQVEILCGQGLKTHGVSG